MSVELFKKPEFSSVYHKHIIPACDEITSMILSYVKGKTDGRPLEMAVDVGCGTGRCTLPLAPHFKKVLGIDISESQINLAKKNTTADNVSYMLAPAEKLPIEDASVDLVNAGLAVHWFDVDKFASEAVRVLKTNGCLALHCATPVTKIEYKDLSHDLSVVMSEVWDSMFQYGDKYIFDHVFSQYRSIYEAIPLKDKELITDIPVTIQVTIPDIIGLIQASYMCQVFKEKDLKGAEEFLLQTEKRFRNILGEKADSVQMNMHMKHYCVLARKD